MKNQTQSSNKKIGRPKKASDITYDPTKSSSSQNNQQQPQLDINNLPPLLTVKEVAQLLRVSPLTVKRWGKRGKLPPIRINSRGDRRYKRESVLYLMGIDPDED